MLIPKLIKILNKAENLVNLLYAKPIVGFLTKYIVVLIVNIALSLVTYTLVYDFSLLNILSISNISSAMLYFALKLSYFNIGNRNNNMNIALSIALLLFYLVIAHVLNTTILLLTLSLLLIVYIIIKLIISEYKVMSAPRYGIGIFFGSFNPVHKAHIKIIQNAIKSRKLSKVLIQVNTIPELHRIAINNKEIISESNGKGFNVYKKTSIAIPGKDYFPTGNKFFDHSIRVNLIKESLNEYALAEKVQILDYDEIYDQKGFPGIIEKIHSSYQNIPLHGIHGSDVGGMWVRYIFDSFSFIYPYPIVRNDGISSTKIRDGIKNLTTNYVQAQIDKIMHE
jgi:hypothetical protein